MVALEYERDRMKNTGLELQTKRNNAMALKDNEISNLRDKVSKQADAIRGMTKKRPVER
jgi:hypothetical protein